MKAYRVIDEARALEIAAALRAETWEQGKSFGKEKVTKRNLELHKSPHLDELGKTIREHSLWSENFVTTMYPPRFNWYRDGGEYRVHSDAAFMGGKVRTDLAMTLFLSEFEGGELCIDGKEVKGKPGIAVVYECWKPHFVKPANDRIALITWFQSRIAESWQRELLNMVHNCARKGDQEHFAVLGAVHEKLLKHWAR